MPLILETDDYGWMQNIQKSTMTDRCIIRRPATGEVNGWGDIVKSRKTGIETICGLKMVDRETKSTDGEIFDVIESDAELRLPLDVEIHPEDEVEITERYGKTISPTIVFSVVRFPRVGPTAQVVLLRRKTA